jgi:hypothetical protein
LTTRLDSSRQYQHPESRAKRMNGIPLRENQT